MANETVNRSRKNLKFSEPIGGMVTASRKTHWIVTASSPKTPDELSFTSRDQSGFIKWWDITAPKTDYWPVHHTLGRAYAFEVLDFLNNPESKDVTGGELGFICKAIANWMPTVAGSAASGVADGFFSAISGYVSTGEVDR